MYFKFGAIQLKSEPFMYLWAKTTIRQRQFPTTFWSCYRAESETLLSDLQNMLTIVMWPI